ncbi:unannotated protein [freshwater metagenome]|uniref:Unannotated protein n=1 Tax=freshwater metagenome TaxID=449393 RepID=A0A6J6ZEB0_9ZZZZ
MHLVEDDQPVPFERRVVLQAAGEDSFGDDLDARGRAHHPFVSSLIADGVPDGFTEQGCHPPSCGAGRQAARFKHHDALPVQPRCIQQHERRQRRLAGARRSDEDRLAWASEGGDDGRKGFEDREIG